MQYGTKNTTLHQIKKKKPISTHLCAFEYVTWPHKAKTLIYDSGSALNLSHQCFDAL